MLLVPLGYLRNISKAGDLLLAEYGNHRRFLTLSILPILRLPIYLFFTLFTLLALWWYDIRVYFLLCYRESSRIEIVYFARYVRNNLLLHMKWVFLAINLLLYQNSVLELPFHWFQRYGFLLAVVITLRVLDTNVDTPLTHCARQENSVMWYHLYLFSHPSFQLHRAQQYWPRFIR